MTAREHDVLAPRLIEKREPRQAAREAQSGLERFSQALRGIGSDAQPIDDCLDRVLAFRVELRQRFHFVHASVDAHSDEPLGGEILQHLRVLALAVAHQRREQCRCRALRQPQNLIDHLAHGLGREINHVIGAAGNPGACVEQAQVVVDLGDGADGRARVV